MSEQLQLLGCRSYLFSKEQSASAMQMLDRIYHVLCMISPGHIGSPSSKILKGFVSENIVMDGTKMHIDAVTPNRWGVSTGSRILDRIFGRITPEQVSETQEENSNNKITEFLKGLDDAQLSELSAHIEEKVERSKAKATDGSLIGARVFNGKEAESELCGLLTDEQVGKLYMECYESIVPETQRSGKCDVMFACDFVIALYKVVGSEFETYRSKIAHFVRVIRDYGDRTFGYVARTIQKGVVWFKHFTKPSRLKNELWAAREVEKHSLWKSVIKDITNFLDARIPQVVSID